MESVRSKESERQKFCVDREVKLADAATKTNVGTRYDDI